MINFSKISNWKPSKNALEIETIDAHTEGEPLRVVIKGFPSLKGTTILEKRNHIIKNYDHIRKAIMLEPRGHADMYGAVITCLLYTSPSPRDKRQSRMPSSA